MLQCANALLHYSFLECVGLPFLECALSILVATIVPAFLALKCGTTPQSMFLRCGSPEYYSINSILFRHVENIHRSLSFSPQVILFSGCGKTLGSVKIAHA